ncbi:MAG: oligoribonuclease [Candidatus Wallbacteria bacterium]|nr:oligoribonuclease [Candidatus Wallbacteria bacterium]
MKNLLWVDLEMSGLDDTKDVILEVAAVVTDIALLPLERYHAVVFHPPEVLAAMHPWCIEHHGQSGLTAECARGLPLEQVEEQLLALFRRHWPNGDSAVLAGNSVGTDRRFLIRWMPKLGERLHYRVLDVSSFKIVFKSRYGIVFDKGEAHRAVSDIDESIAELGHYLQHVKIER